ncbi:MAG: transketolase [Candidatus Altarchaeaceae archaeon]
MNKDIENLEKISNFIRGLVILSTTFAGSGHPGGALSSADIITALYFKKLRHNPKNPKWEKRCRFILSKGHSVPALYAALSLCGYFEVEKLKTLRKIDSILQGHPDALRVPGIEASTGSLGQGISIGVGIALAAKLDNNNYNTYVLTGDGECDEGQIWEAFMSANNFAKKGRIGNLTVIIDRNRLQIDGNTEDVMALEPLAEKIKSFGWNVLEIDGHNFNEILDALNKNFQLKAIIANTIKGKGVKFMENNPEWHGKSTNYFQCILALKDLNFAIDDEIYEIAENSQKKIEKKENVEKQILEKCKNYCYKKFDEISIEAKNFVKNLIPSIL